MTLFLFLIAFVALGTIQYWAKYILGGIIIGWHLLMILFVVGFLALIVISIAQNSGRPVQLKRTWGMSHVSAEETERMFHQMHPEAPSR